MKLPNNYIGIIGFFFSLGSVLSGFSFSNIVQRSKNKQKILNIIIIVNIFLLLLLITIENPILFMLAVFIIGYLSPSLIGTNISESKNKGLTVSISSLGFIMGYLVGGMVGNFKTMLLVIAIQFALSLLLSYRFCLFSNNIQETNSTLDAFSILKKNWYIYLGLFLRHTGAASIWLYLSYILINNYNLNLTQIGILHAINIFIQTISNPLVYRFITPKNTLNFIAIGYVLSSTYFVCFILSKNFIFLSFLQVILGLSFTVLYLANIEYLSNKNEEKITSLALLSSTFSMSNLVGALISSYIIKYGYVLLFINGFVLSLASLLIILLAKKIDRHQDQYQL
ncbi:MAG: MFS transporter [bacterium]